MDEITRRHLAEVDRRNIRLTALRGELRRMMDACGHGRVGDCRIIQVIGDHSLCEYEHWPV